jgi:uncharacterized membrane protein YhaH (DUF805 family)
MSGVIVLVPTFDSATLVARSLTSRTLSDALIGTVVALVAVAAIVAIVAITVRRYRRRARQILAGDYLVRWHYT